MLFESFDVEKFFYHFNLITEMIIKGNQKLKEIILSYKKILAP